ncbi:probable G-protein coupled receptor 142 [Budorcas taxicolor]|uniref:probable G-protein coupled receptor 142 n=1 Tax=Budorcas taxicolor TaxID=37181 RepID=UPI002285051A|nr:probable G-protein coupled receptor 142 [Budorcas taxicolor]
MGAVAITPPQVKRRSCPAQRKPLPAVLTFMPSSLHPDSPPPAHWLCACPSRGLYHFPDPIQQDRASVDLSVYYASSDQSQWTLGGMQCQDLATREQQGFYSVLLEESSGKQLRGSCRHPRKKPQGDPGPRSMRLAAEETAAQLRVTLLPTPNSSGLSRELEGRWPESPAASPCVAGVIPVIYYSILLGLGLPVNLLTTVALARLAARTRKPSYYYLLALTASDIVTQVVIVFVGFLLQGAVLAREVPQAVVRTANILEFAANHASVWIAVLLTVDRHRALCHPLRHRATSSPGRARRAVAAVLSAALLTGIPFYWWLDVWRDTDPPSTLDEVLKWAHCLTVYFIPCGVFLVANLAIVRRLQQRGRSGPRPQVGKSTAILLGVTTLFALLWAPRIFVMLYHLYVAPVYRDWRVHLALDVANMVAMLNTVVNFGLYCFVSKSFRATVREVFQDTHLPCTLGSRSVGTVAEPMLKPLGLPKGAEL